MAIKTTADWNARMPCCCGMPLCPEPIFRCSSLTAIGQICGFSDFAAWNTHGGWSAPPCSSSAYSYSTVTRTVTATRTGGDGLTYNATTVSSYARAEDGIACTFDVDEESTGTFPGTFGFSIIDTRTQGATAGGYFFEYQETGENSLGWVRTVTDRLEYSGRIDNRPHLISQMGAILTKALAEDAWHPGSGILIRGSECSAETATVSTTACGAISPPLPRTMRQTRTSVQLVVPAEVDGDPFTGTWFRAKFDVAFFPADESDPTILERNVIREWEGPGSGDQDDASWNLGDPYVLIPPDADGVVAMVNFRWSCIRTDAGTPEQTSGTQVEARGNVEGPNIVNVRTIHDDLGFWPEVYFGSDMGQLIGNPNDGWQTADGTLRIQLERSYDLVTWETGGFIDDPENPVDQGDGTWAYWARPEVPIYWQSTMLDLVITSDRSGKSITSLTVLGTAVSLPNFPYDIPADAAQLQSDIRAAGYDGATVTADTATALSVRGRNYLSGSAAVFYFTLSGTDVTAVRIGSPSSSPISLPSYPYAMPSQRATLQTHLRSAGYAGAVVTLHAGEWEIVFPDLLASGNTRVASVVFTPGDPYPTFDFFGSYQGEAAANAAVSVVDNVRDPLGNALQEATKQFFRAKLDFLAPPL